MCYAVPHLSSGKFFKRLSLASKASSFSQYAYLIAILSGLVHTRLGLSL